MKLFGYKIPLFAALIFIVFCISCYNKTKTSTTTNSASTQTKKPANYASIYNPSIKTLHPHYKIFHDNDVTSTLTGVISLSDLQINQTGEVKEFKTDISIHYELFEYNDGRIEPNPIMADSATYKYSVKLDKNKKRFYSMFAIKATKGKQYLLNVVTSDILHSNSTINTLVVDKTSALSSQNFEIKDLTGYPFFEPYVIDDADFRINMNDTTIDSIYIFYYSPKPNLPEKIFSPSVSKPEYITPDSIWKLPYNTGLAYRLLFQGLYFIKTDSLSDEGVTLLYMPEGYPKVVRADQMFEPLTYITTETELAEVQKPINKKLAIDNFWIGISKNMDAAKELIRIYYNRVAYANFYFTSYKEGWKTDKGMVFIIYGPPSIMRRINDREEWVYYDGVKESYIVFIFDLNPNPFCSTEYTLNRAESKNIAWQEAINSWRSGKVYTLTNPQ